jgi:serine/threonine protein kinase
MVDDARWTQCTPSEYAWERSALAYLKSVIPDREPYRAWANAEFIGADGSVNEIDLLLIAPAGVVLVEVKSWSGILTGDAGTWQQEHRAPVDNPVIGANRKARKMKSLLAAQPALRGRRLPWVDGVVFLSEPALEVRLTSEGRANVYGTKGQPSLPSIAGYLTRQGPVDASLGRAIRRAIEQAGIRESQRARTVGSFRVQLPAIQEGPGWQDFAARHERFPEDPPRRVRIYLADRAESAGERQLLVRAAEREYRSLRGIDYPGIAVPTDFVEHDLGPALIFPYDESLVRLDRFLRQSGRDLAAEERLGLLRSIAETIAYAHRRKLAHRALNPQCVWVRPSAAGLAVQVTDWQAASRSDGSASSGASAATSTRGYAELAELGATAYFAPEWQRGSRDGVALDVFGMGTIAYHVIVGRPPAASYAELCRYLQEHKFLSVLGQADAVPDAIDQLVRHATAADPAGRTPDMAEFLLDLDRAREAILAAEEQPLVTDPLEAQAGDELEGGYTVLQRLGRGATAVALLVEDDGREAVLKVSLDPSRDSRLEAEAAALAGLGRQAGVVELLSEGVIEVGPRRALLLSYAGKRTLAQEIRQRGRLQPEWLQDWGDDLLEIMDVLQRRGVSHRDIKPDNLGVAERGGKGKKRQLVLFDFSLAAEPLDATDVGTPPYLDPFLGDGERRTWDPAAERYAAAVTLYEMATGRRPEYGERGGHPGYTDADVTIDPELFDRSYAAGLAEFFRTALHRDAKRRFGTAEEMRRAWNAVFANPATVTVEPAALRVTRDTPIGAAGLSPQVLAALERLSIMTAGAASDLSPAQATWLPGIGTTTRRRLRDELAGLRTRIAETTAQPPAEPTLLDEMAARLVPDNVDRTVAETLLGLGEPTAPRRTARLGDGAWTSPRDTARLLRADQRTVRQAMSDLERHWLRLDGMRELRDTVVEVVEAAGGVAAALHCAAALLDHEGSTVAEPLRTRLAEAVLRAVIDTELADQRTNADPRLTYSREARGILIAAGPAHAGAGPSTAERLEWAERLGRAADELARADPLPVPATVIETLRAVPMPGNADPSLIFPERLVEIAVIASQDAAATSRLEIYQRGLDPDRALRLAAGALYGADEITPEQVAQRIKTRFPEAKALPGRPGLDAVLRAAGIPLRWDEQAKHYRGEVAQGRGLTSLRTTTTHPTAVSAPSRASLRLEDQVVAADDELERSLQAGGWLVLSVDPRRVAQAQTILETRPVSLVDVEAVMLGGMREFAERHNVRWPTVLAADAAEPGTPDHHNLRRVADAGIAKAREAIESSGPAVLLVNAGILARYGTTLLDDMREAVRTATAGSPVRTVWLLVPWADRQQPPLLDGAAIPLLGNQWLPLPREWATRHKRPDKGGTP